MIGRRRRSTLPDGCTWRPCGWVWGSVNTPTVKLTLEEHKQRVVGTALFKDIPVPQNTPTAINREAKAGSDCLVRLEKAGPVTKPSQAVALVFTVKNTKGHRFSAGNCTASVVDDKGRSLRVLDIGRWEDLAESLPTVLPDDSAVLSLRVEPPVLKVKSLRVELTVVEQIRPASSPVFDFGNLSLSALAR